MDPLAPVMATRTRRLSFAAGDSALIAHAPGIDADGAVARETGAGKMIHWPDYNDTHGRIRTWPEQ